MRSSGVAATCVVALMLISACSREPVATPAEGAEESARGGTLRLMREAPRSLDPLVADSVYESLPVNQIFDTLVEFDPSLNLRPGLAGTWTVTRDGTVYTFKLREGVRFHNGDGLTAADAVFSLSRNLHPNNAGRSLAFSSLLLIEGAAEYAAGTAPSVRGLTAVDQRTLEIRLKRAYSSFLEVLAMDPAAIVPQRVVRELGDERFSREPVGTGPFRFREWGEDRLVLEANVDYFRGAPLLDSVLIRFLADDDIDFGAERFFRGELDLLEPATESLPRLAADPGVRLYRYQELSLSFLGLSGSVPPMDRRWMRQAVTHAINRRGMVDESPELRREAMGILPPGIAGYTPEFKALEYDPEKARAILAAAGHPGGSGLPPVRICNPSMGPAAKRVLERIEADLAAVGIRLEVVPVTWAELAQMLDDRSAPSFLLAWIADRTDPDALLRELFGTAGSANYFSYSSDRVDELLAEGRAERNPNVRTRVYREMERTILEDAPIVPLYNTVGVLAEHSNVRGLEPSPLGLAKAELERVWLADGGAGS